MGVMTDIQTALLERLSLLDTSAHPVAYENRDYKYEQNKPWIRAVFIPQMPRQSSLGTNGQNEHRGIFQIDLFYMADTGPLYAQEIVDSIVDNFKRGLILTSGSTTVTIERTGQAAALDDRGWYVVPVSVYFRAYAEN